ncbi:hypothetical protein BJ979_003420 [Schumannella luteola]|uniref:Uncharacterized protein n=1 Tax=Schumannella luteola TaxID=472059 RepID=A0A852Y7B8_9MICO|nr:hypothetical protein [Schumannella luteola]NYG98856.1 hypothetical protein [Schumannella luteola]NYH00795.1 hypothetical protein [Schumannella luteola]
MQIDAFRRIRRPALAESALIATDRGTALSESFNGCRIPVGRIVG